MSADTDPLTKADLIDFQNRLLTTLQEQFAAADRRTQSQLTALEERIQGQFTALETRIQEQFAASELHMREYVESIETRLLTAFHAWASPINARIRRIEVGESGVNERLISLEERLMNLEKRLWPPNEAA